MNTPSKTLSFLLNLARVHAVLARRFDSSLGGVGMSDFLILYHLSTAEGETMRRIDLAEKIGLTASGVTRLLAPMEKIGLIKRSTDKNDARVSYVTLAPGGKRVYSEALDRAEIFCEDRFNPAATQKISKLSPLLDEIQQLVK